MCGRFAGHWMSPSGAGQREDLQGRARGRRQLHRLRGTDVDAVGRPDLELAARNVHRTAAGNDEQDDVPIAECDDRRARAGNLQVNLRLIQRAQFCRDEVAVSQGATRHLCRQRRRDHVTVPFSCARAPSRSVTSGMARLAGLSGSSRGEPSGRFAVRPVAKGRRGCLFATTQEHFLVRVGDELPGFEASSLMGSVAKRLVGRATTAAPEIGPPALERHQTRFRPRNNRFCHSSAIRLRHTRRRLYSCALGSTGLIGRRGAPRRCIDGDLLGGHIRRLRQALDGVVGLLGDLLGSAHR